MNKQIKAIETLYNNVRFRSRLEAKWAVYFDSLGAKWENEPEGFKLSDGSVYLPDFWFPAYDVYGEAKPDNFKEGDDPRHEKFVMESGKKLILFIGAPGKNVQTMLRTMESTESNDGITFWTETFYYTGNGIAFGDYIFGKYDEFLYGSDDLEDYKFTSAYQRAVRLANEAKFGHEQTIPRAYRMQLEMDARHWVMAIHKRYKPKSDSSRPVNPCPSCGADQWMDKVIESVWNPDMFYCQSCKTEYEPDRTGLKQ